MDNVYKFQSSPDFRAGCYCCAVVVKSLRTTASILARLESQAQSIGVDDQAFRKCLEGGKYASQVRDSVNRMSQLGIDSTPTFLLGVTPAPGQPFKILKVVRGALTFILTRGIGQSFIEKNVDPAAVRAYLDEMR